MADDKDFSDENKKRMLVSLAILQGADVENRPTSWSLLSKEQKNAALETYKERHLQGIVEKPERMFERDIQIEVAETGIQDKVQFYKIVGVKDDRTCPDCASYQGKIVTMGPNPYGLPTVQDFINGHLFHIGCRCSLQELLVDEIPLNILNPRRDERKAARPEIYNDAPTTKLVFN